MNVVRRMIVLACVALMVSVTLASVPAGPAAARSLIPDRDTPGTRAVPTGPLDWPQFRFDDAHTGVNPFETTITRSNAPFLSLAWQAQLGNIVFSSSPTVVNGVVYIGSTDGTLWAYPGGGCGQDFCDTPLWRSTNLAQIVDTPTVADGNVYVGSQTSFDSAAGKLNVFDADGCGKAVCKPMWQGLAGSQSILESSPTVANGVVYVGAFDGRLYAFDVNGCADHRCKPLWTGRTGGSIESTPTMDGSTVLVGSDDGNLYAFPAAGCGDTRCRPTWVGPIGYSVFESTPAIANGRIYIGSQHSVAVFHAGGCGHKTCQPLWEDQYQGDLSFFGGSPTVYKGRVYIGVESELGVFDANGCGQAVCGPLYFDFGSGAQAAIASSPTVVNGVVFAGRNTAEVLAWSTKPCGQFECGQLWKGLTNESIVNSSPTIVDGTVYIGSADRFFPEDQSGRIYVYDLSNLTG
jgi:outer membrane protein assembly factor BamB